MDGFGKELILDMHGCNATKFNRYDIGCFMIELCHRIDMKREDLHYWDYDGYPEEYKNAPDHLKGITAIQFIRTSNITIHTLDVRKRIYLNIFSCKDFDNNVVKDFCLEYWGGLLDNEVEVERT